MILLVYVLEGSEETARDAMFLIQIYSALGGLVANYVSMRKIFSNNSRAGLLFLCNLIGVTLGICGVVASIIVVGSSSAGDLNMACAKLSVV